MVFRRQLWRFEILLPLTYNDGSPVEQIRFTLTREELDTIFGGSTYDVIPASGHWFYQGVLYDDALIRLRLDIPHSRDNINFFRQYKKVLKARFRQLDIWMTVYKIRIL